MILLIKLSIKLGNKMNTNTKCRIINEPLEMVVDFGKQPLGNGFLTKENFCNEYFFEMQCGFNEKSMMFQLINQPEPEKMFHENYAFFSSTSNYMKKHFFDFYESCMNSDFMPKDPFVIELGCNDGIMLENFAKNNIRHLGIEPSKNVAIEANKKGVKTISKFFDASITEEIINSHGKADLFLAANVMCHIPNINSVVEGIKNILNEKGVVIFEDPYLGDVIEKVSYDQIYDEHVFLFSAHSIQFLFGQYDMELIDVERQTTHGGSMRYTLAHKEVYPVSLNVKKIINWEKKQGLNKIETFHNFQTNIEKSKEDLLKLLNNLRKESKDIFGYAATSKSTTILNYCGIGPDLISKIYDTTPLKHGKFSPGMHIPIINYSEFKFEKSDFGFLFAWNHSKEIINKELDYSKNGGKWITHVPNVGFIKI